MTTKQKNIATASLVLFALLLIVGAQQPSKPDIAIPPPQIQSEVAQASKAESDALKAYQASITATQAALYRAMAEAGVRPSECASGDNPFACIRQVKEGIGFERKPVVKPSP